MSFRVLFFGAFLVLISGRNVERNGRFFGYRYTSTEVIPKMVTSLIPSSCVQVEASLPPCRNVRNLDAFPRFLGGRIEEESAVLPSIHTTALGWGEYLGIYAPTVTVTAIHLETTTIPDPRTVVTFSVKGCKPSKLPLDLQLCPSALSAEIIPTSTVTEPQPTATLTLPKDMDTKLENLDTQNHLDLIQPTEHVITVSTQNNSETEKLTTS